MIELFIYFVIGIVVGMLFMREFNVDHDSMDMADYWMIGCTTVFWPFGLTVILVMRIGRIPGKCLEWYENWRNAQYKKMTEDEVEFNKQLDKRI